MRILLIAPSGPEMRYLRKGFAEAAHSLEQALDARDGAFLAAHEPFDAIVLLRDAPVGHGAALSEVQGLARVAQGASLIVIDGTPAPFERVELLRAGADACFSRPFSFMELHERIRRLARANALPCESGIALTLNAQARTVVQGGHETAVTRHEFLLMECLLRERNAPVGREQLIRYAWADKEEIDPASVNLVVSRLRRKLQSNGFAARIETVSGVGYRLCLEAAP
jgi:two-component system OmpR family response regulator